MPNTFDFIDTTKVYLPGETSFPSESLTGYLAWKLAYNVDDILGIAGTVPVTENDQ